jgi:hypothetical protein
MSPVVCQMRGCIYRLEGVVRVRGVGALPPAAPEGDSTLVFAVAVAVPVDTVCAGVVALEVNS